jgi:LPXTG-motif cell wall-anchored protein
MSKPVNYALLDELLADDSLSLRECARRASCSDWSARQRYRELSGDDRAMKTPRLGRYNGLGESQDALPLTGAEKAIAWSIIALLVLGVAALSWYARRDDFAPYIPREGPMS